MYGPSVTPLARTVLALSGQSSWCPGSASMPVVPCFSYQAPISAIHDSRSGGLSRWPASVIAPSIRYFISPPVFRLGHPVMPAYPFHEPLAHGFDIARCPGHAGDGTPVTVPAGRVSYMRTATTRPEAAVRAATTQIAATIPNASAIAPASSAPTANPPSRHSRYTPTERARQAGWETSPTAASSVGYTMAVPAPSSTAATAHGGNVVPMATRASPAACTPRPAAISHLRPMRSDSAPVTSCPAPQTAG